jgi:hypothetical protein
LEQIANFFRDPLTQGILAAVGAAGVLVTGGLFLLRQLRPNPTSRPALPSISRVRILYWTLRPSPLSATTGETVHRHRYEAEVEIEFSNKDQQEAKVSLRSIRMHIWCGRGRGRREVQLEPAVDPGELVLAPTSVGGDSRLVTLPLKSVFIEGYVTKADFFPDASAGKPAKMYFSLTGIDTSLPQQGRALKPFRGRIVPGSLRLVDFPAVI